MARVNAEAIFAHNVASDDGGDWEDPDRRVIDQGLAPPPPLPLHVFGPRWAGWLDQFARSKSAPVDFAVGSLLAAAAAALGAARAVSPKPGWTEFPALWCLLVGS